MSTKAYFLYLVFLGRKRLQTVCGKLELNIS